MDWDNILSGIPGYDPFRDAKDDYVFNAERASKAINFIQNYCRHTKGELAGEFVKLEDWQMSVVANLFGWLNKENVRRYREMFFYVGRKIGKSLLCACIGNYLLFCDGEKGSEIYCAAAERDQASLVWGMAKQQIIYDKSLNRFEVYVYYINEWMLSNIFPVFTSTYNYAFEATLDYLAKHK